uniref:RING-type E3 ubiquitin transferase n=1 Tax=Fagus sylvatica TaxID=28930 RepID=A0A2N9F6U1_FAGSY
MNGLGSTSNSFPQNFSVDQGPDVNNLGFLQNNVVPTDASVPDSHTVMGHVGQSSSSLNTQHQINPHELLRRYRWLSSTSSLDGTGQRLQGRNSELNIAPFQDGANIIPNDDQVTNRLANLQGASSGALPWNIDLNAFHESSSSDINQDMGACLSLGLLNPDGLEADENPHASNSSVPHMIPSGLTGQVLEENAGRGGLSLDGRQLPCKRRAPEDAPGLLSLGESSSSAQGSQRNIRLRRAENIEDFVPLLRMFVVHCNIFKPSPWCDLTRSRPGVLSTPVYAVNGGDTLQQELNSRSIQRNALSGTHFISAPTRVPEGNMAEQYSQRLSVNHSTAASAGFESRRQGGSCPLNLGTSAAVREMELSVRGGNARPQIRLRSGLMTRPERQAGGHPENPFALQFNNAAQRRRRLVAEIRNALALARRGPTFRFEDVMVIDRSVLYAVPEEDDMHEDMRLDVDNMSYEELVDLEEDIGNVSTGPSEQAILANLRRRKYEPIALGSPVNNESCCICQEEYAQGDDLGKLDCGHDYHYACIKQWLVQKNSCPICKMTALSGIN